MGRRRHFLARLPLRLAAACTALAVACGGALAQQDALRFADPGGLFSMTLPGDAEIRGAEEPVLLKVVSRHGWLLTVQSGAANQKVDFRGMIAKLEERYLGDNRVWTKKIGERTLVLGGLPALEAVYEATRSRWQAIIARGNRTDFVIMVSAPAEVFADRGAEIAGALASFAPRADEIPAAAVPPRPAAAQAQAPAQAPADAPPPTRQAPPQADPVPQLTQAFDEPGFGFAIGYPEDWTVDQPDPFTRVFSGRQGSDAYYATVSIQNVSPPGAGDSVAAAEAAFDDHRAKMAAAAQDLAYVVERGYTYERQGVELRGQEFLATYVWQGQPFSAWVVVLPNPTQPVAHIFSYAAPEARFRRFQPVAQAMLRSWAITGTEESDATR